MVVAIAVLELHLPSARSLKDKRRVVKSLIERMHARFRVSIAETDFHDLHQRAEIGVAAVARSERELQQLMSELRRLADDEVEAVVARWEPQYLEDQA
jgi:uncharacterized protein YlxP (DUF503 family)